MALEKAKFINNNTNDVIVVQFNPSSLSIVSSAVVLDQKTQQLESDNTVLNLCGIQNKKLEVTLVLDAYIDNNSFLSQTVLASFINFNRGGRNVKQIVDNFESFMNSSSEISFIWGKIIFTGFINKLSTQYEMFESDGTPVRASVVISMEENDNQDQEYLDFDFDEDYFDMDEDANEENILSKIIDYMNGGA